MTHDTPATILVAEDDATTRTFLADELTADGYDLLVAESAADALRLLETKFPDLAILDVGLGDRSGLEVVRGVRAADGAVSRIDPDLAVLVLSGRCGEVDRVRAFEAGADDFVAKPYSYAELRGRVGALLRRTERRRRPSRVRIGALEIDPASRDVRLGGRRIELTQKEFALLRVLAGEPTTVHTKVRRHFAHRADAALLRRSAAGRRADRGAPSAARSERRRPGCNRVDAFR
jgi:DNA-binding response OmpR family regulator